MIAVASANGILPQPTGKATRAAVVARFEEEHSVYAGAKFALAAAETKALAERAQEAGFDFRDDDNALPAEEGPGADVQGAFEEEAEAA